MENLKKKMLCISLFLVVVVSVCFRLNTRNMPLDSLMLENIEALASGEWDVDIECIGFGSVDCPGRFVKVYFYGFLCYFIFRYSRKKVAVANSRRSQSTAFKALYGRVFL